MTPEDRELLLSLRREQQDLQQALGRLNSHLELLEARAQVSTPRSTLPPLPTVVTSLPAVPPMPAPVAVRAEPASAPLQVLPPRPIPVLPVMPPLPAPISRRSLEWRFGRWLTWLGALFGVILVASILALSSVQTLLGHAGLLAVSAAISVGVLILGERLERQKGTAVYFGRTLIAMALAWLYLTAYAACENDSLRVISSPLIGGLVLLLWSIYVFLLAERRKSQAVGLFAVTLAYFSTAINPLDRFTMAADLLLAATAAVFLLRNGWAVLTCFSLAGTYLALLRRLLIDQGGDLVLDTSRSLHFLPHAVYLITAWFLFTFAAIFTKAASFRGGKRLAVVSLNNAALACLLTLTAYIAGYGTGAMGWALLTVGLLFLVTSRFAGFAAVEPVDIMRAYAAQGLAAVTAGIIVVFTGVTRAVFLLVETFLLGIAAAFSEDRTLTVSTYVAGAFATFFSIWEIAVYGHHPWLLGFGGAAIMLINAWSSRGQVRHSPLARSTIVLSSSCYCALALGLIFTALWSELSKETLPPMLALVAVALTFSIYYVTLYELPPLAQLLLLIAQWLVVFPADTGEELPWWSTGCVAAVTLLLVAWWSRQRTSRTGAWITVLTFLYALALVGLAIRAMRPYLGTQDWMIAASFLSVAFLIFGAFFRVWALAAMGQLFLVIAVYHFFFPTTSGAGFPWSWAAALVPVVVVFATARAALEWLRVYPETREPWRGLVRVLAYAYQLLALVMLVRWVFAIVPPLDQIASFLFLGTLVLSSNVRTFGPLFASQQPAFGVRCSFVLSALGVCLYLDNLQTHAGAMATFVNALAILFLLGQPALLRLSVRPLVSAVENWTLVIVSVGLGWLFVSSWVLTRITPAYLTMGWAVYALFLFLLGLATWDRRLRWCGLAVLLAAIVRVFCYDFWGLSSGYRVLTFLVLTLITLGLGYIILRFADRRQTWL
jgi:hypothetical protein